MDSDVAGFGADAGAPNGPGDGLQVVATEAAGFADAEVPAAALALVADVGVELHWNSLIRFIVPCSCFANDKPC